MKLAVVFLMLAVGVLAEDVPPPAKLVPEHKQEEVPPIVNPSAPYSYVYPYASYPYSRYWYYPYAPYWYTYPYAAAPAARAAPVAAPVLSAAPAAPLVTAAPAAPAANLFVAPYRLETPVGASTYYGQWN